MRRIILIVRNFVKAILVYILLSSFIFSSGDDSRLAKIIKQLSKFRNEYPQQKVYLQLDKTVYSAGENVWFKAYLVDAADQLPDTMSTNLYVELVNAKGTRVQAHMLRMANGFSHGDFILRDTVTEGNYLVKAYTGWMNNFDAGLIFKKNIYIRNSVSKNSISSDDLRFNKKFNRRRVKLNDRFDIQFLPEGGEMICGVNCRVAFKATNGSGKGIEVEGKIIDNKNNKIADLASIHLGMGAFIITPESGKTYEAIVKLAGSVEKKIELRPALEHGISIFVDNTSSEEFIRLILRSNLLPSQDEIVRDFMVIAQNNGNICYSGSFNFKSDSFILSIPKSKIPTGITQITIFNGRSAPIAERLIFINHHDELKVNIVASIDTVQSSNQVSVKLRFQNKSGEPVSGNFSAAFTDAKQVDEPVDESNILNTLRLTSDIRGVIEKPDWYFNSSGPEREVSLDLLMMTQGWRRFDWKKILADQYPKIEFPEEKGIVISGQITRDFFGIPVKKAPVYLTILSAYNDYFSGVTDDKGRYKFGSLVYYDTMSVVVEASKPNGKKNVQILVDETLSPKANIQSGESFEQEVLAKGTDWKYAKVKRPDNREKEREHAKKREKYSSSRIYGEADNIIYMDDIPDGYSDMFQVIQGRVPGVVVGGNSILIRGVNSIFGSTDPLYLIDGVGVDPATFRALNPKDVEMVEFLKGPSAAIFGSRGSNGVIAAYTKRGDYMKRGYIDFKMLAYYTAREFYSSSLVSETPEHVLRPPETVYWKPDIKIGDNGESSITFRMKEKVQLRLILEGLSLNGIPGYTNQLLNF